MNLKFLTLKFRNFLSYGNNITEFNFKNGLHSIYGKNAQGKCVDPSTQIEIMIEDKEILKKFKNFLKENNS